MGWGSSEDIKLSRASSAVIDKLILAEVNYHQAEWNARRTWKGKVSLYCLSSAIFFQITSTCHTRIFILHLFHHLSFPLLKNSFLFLWENVRSENEWERLVIYNHYGTANTCYSHEHYGNVNSQCKLITCHLSDFQIYWTKLVRDHEYFWEYFFVEDWACNLKKISP